MAEYGYDPEGYRVVKRAKGETIHYIFEGTEPIFEKKITSGDRKSYVYALGTYLARVDGVIKETNEEVYFYHTDHIGSIRAVTDQSGEVVFNTDYLAFGQRYGENTNGGFVEYHGFTGKEYDPDTGLYYYNARWYDADIGRFISEDPAADPNNPNLYVYGRNNPLRFVDPTGLTTVADIGVTPGSTGASYETLSTTHIDGGGQYVSKTANPNGTRTYTETNSNGGFVRSFTFYSDGSLMSEIVSNGNGTLRRAGYQDSRLVFDAIYDSNDLSINQYTKFYNDGSFLRYGPIEYPFSTEGFSVPALELLAALTKNLNKLDVQPGYPNWWGEHNSTWCNLLGFRVGMDLGLDISPLLDPAGIDYTTANAAAQNARNAKNRREIFECTESAAQFFANQGCFVPAVAENPDPKKSGHMGVVVASNNPQHMNDPLIGQQGTTPGFRPASQSFGGLEVHYYVIFVSKEE